MARNLIKAGHELKVFDLSEEAINYIAQSGAKAANSIQDAASDVDALITMLPVGGDVTNVLMTQGAIGAASPGTLIIDSSTIDVESARAAHGAAMKPDFPCSTPLSLGAFPAPKLAR